MMPPAFSIRSLALLLTLGWGGLVPAQARPAWSLGASMGGAWYDSRPKPRAWAGEQPSYFGSLQFGLEAEKSWRGILSLGVRGHMGLDENALFIPHKFSRALFTVIPYVKRTAYQAGPFDFSGLVGLGYEGMEFDYSGDHDPREPPDPTVPGSRYFQSPVLAGGVSQRLFFWVAGLTANETVTASFNTIAMRLDFLFSVGWRKR
jgi:hypothetical protein